MRVVGRAKTEQESSPKGNVSFKRFSTREREIDCHVLRQRDPGKLVILMLVVIPNSSPKRCRDQLLLSELTPS